MNTINLNVLINDWTTPWNPFVYKSQKLIKCQRKFENKNIPSMFSKGKQSNIDSKQNRFQSEKHSIR